MWTSKQIVESLTQSNTDAHRVATTPDYFIDRFSTSYLISLRVETSIEAIVDRLHRWVDDQGLSLQHLFARRLTPNTLQAESIQVLIGDPISNDIPYTRENGLIYGIDFFAGHSPGLFIDQRENRRFLESLQPQNLLNCFAYTCAFSVAAARAGAKTLSVDLSKKWLNWGKSNFELNHLSLMGHRFYVDDVSEVLKRLPKRGEQFDLIVLDPPTFARRGRQTFRVEKDFCSLIELALPCLTEGGYMLLSTNLTRWGANDLKDLAWQIAHDYGKLVSFHQSSIPQDIPIKELPSTVWAKFTSHSL